MSKFDGDHKALKQQITKKIDQKLKSFELLQYLDYSTAPAESDIYEITQTEMIAEPDMEDSTFSEVVKFYIDQATGDYFPKFAQVGVKRWSDEDNFVYVGQKHQINLSQYLEQK